MWQVVFAYRRIVLSMTGIVFLISTIYYSVLPNVYTGEVQLLVEVPPERHKPFEETEMQVYAGVDEFFETQIAILTGGNIKKTVREELNLDEKYKFKLQANRFRGTQIISLKVEDRDPVMAAKIANKFYEVYMLWSAQQDLFMPQQFLKLLPSDEDLSEKGTEQAALKGISKQEYAESLRSVSRDPIIQKLKNDRLDVEAELKEYSQRYKAKHPLMKELNEKLIYLNASMEDRVRQIISALRTGASGEFQITNIKLLEEAVPPKAPSGPRRTYAIFLCTVIGFFSSVFFVWLMEYTNQKIRTEEDLGLNFGTPFLGYVPLIKDLVKHKGRDRAEEDWENRNVLEIFNKDAELKDALVLLRTRFLFSMPLEKSKRIMITSVMPDEGKSTISALLAAALAQMGEKVLLISSDIRRPLLAKYLGVSTQKGLTDFLVGTVSKPSEIIMDVSGSSFKLISAGSATPNPTELLESRRLPELLESVSKDFDRILIDATPVLYIPDGFMIAKHVHSSILICGAGMIHRRVARDVVKKFSDLNHPFIGVVINRVVYGKGAYSYHYKYYKAHKKYYKKRDLNETVSDG